MPDYRLYYLDGAGKISRAEAISAPSDDEAVTVARTAKHSTRRELWLRDRRVAEIPATKDAPGAKGRGGRPAG